MGALNRSDWLPAGLWALRRSACRLGPWGLFAVAAMALAVSAWAVARQQAAVAAAAGQRWLDRPSVTAPLVRDPLPDARARLQRFDARLLAHDDLPTQVQDLIHLAEAQQLSVDRGDYRAQVDGEGRFLRYRMSLPVRGAWPAVHRFIGAALRAHPALGLEGVQFARPQSATAEVEARLQWVVLARLPESAAPALKARP